MKHPGGRPPAFKDVKTLQEAIDKYFLDCDSHTKQMPIWTGKTTEVVEVRDPYPYTMGGLAYALGINRRTLMNYTKKEKFFPTVMEARRRVIADQERLLLKGGNAYGAAFALKNNDQWEDKTRVDQYNHEFKITRASSSKDAQNVS